MYQQQNKTSFTGTEMLFALLKKIKLIIGVALAVTIVATAVCAAIVFANISYGGSISYYLTKTDTTDKLLPSLTSETFAEKLLLDEYGLPAEYATDPNYKDAYEEAKQAVIAYNKVREEIKEVAKNYSRISVSLTSPKDPYTGETISSFYQIEKKYEELQQSYEDLYNLVYIYKSVNAEEIVTEEHKLQVQKLEIELEQARVARDAYKKSAYEPAILEKTTWDAKYAQLKNKLDDTRETAENLVSSVLSDWRKNKAVIEKVNLISNSIAFSYDIPGNDGSIIEVETTASTPDTEPKGHPFLKVYVTVEGDEELANFIIDGIKRVLPEHVEKNIEKFGGSVAPQCVLMSPFSNAVALNKSNAMSNTVLAAVVAFVVTVAIVCLAILGKEWTARVKSEQEAALNPNNTPENK